MENKFSVFNSQLLEWYFTQDKRNFPWRKTKDPYGILVAEIMLQRTKANQVVPVYLSFMKRFPSPDELCRAGLTEIEEYFSKLGLMWRAKKVKLMAKKLSLDFKGLVPRKKSQLLSIPGVGEYVSDAVLCFAFREDTPIVDSNVCRVLGRVFDLKPKGEPRRDPIYRQVATQLIPEGKCSEFNWALIDHANEICTPRNPKCEICPLNRVCSYYASKQKCE